MLSCTSKVLRKSTFNCRPRRTRQFLAPNLAALTQARHSSNSGGSSSKIGRWLMRRIYGTIVIIGVSTGGLLVV